MRRIIHSFKARAKRAIKNAQSQVTAKSYTDSSYVIEIERPEEQLRKIDKNNYLASYAKNIASQGGEDGVIEKIFKIIGINEPGWCVEFGACDGKTDSNTWNLVKNKGWKAVYIEPEPTFFKKLEEHCQHTPNSYCFSDLVGWDGANSLDNILARTPVSKNLEFMVIDIDGNDYYVWEALQNYQPEVVCIEFHRLIHPSVDFVQPKDPSLNHPASIKTLTELAKRKGYELVCVINWNLFFVRKEHFVKFVIDDNRPESMYYPFEEMRIFQGYDGTVFSFNNCNHYWKYLYGKDGVITNIQMTHNDMQVIPEGLRIFQPRHLYHCKALEAQAGKLDASLVPENRLLNYRKNTYSECGEDGILEHIFSVLKLTHEQRFCVDIGACDGVLWSNTRNLIMHQKWSGLLLEKDNACFQALTNVYKSAANVRCVQTEVLPSDITKILQQNNITKEFGLLSIDIEGNDYHVWKALSEYKPYVVVMDFNPSINNDILFIQQNDNAIHYGSSLLALVKLAKSKGYELAAVTDWNAIFVRKDQFSSLGITNNDLKGFYYAPFEMRMFQTLDGCLHLKGCSMLVRQDYQIEWEDFQVLPAKLRGRDNSFSNFGKMHSVFYGDERLFQSYVAPQSYAA